MSTVAGVAAAIILIKIRRPRIKLHHKQPKQSIILTIIITTTTITV
jgi:hypothetical protein